MTNKPFCFSALALLALGGFFLGFSGSVDDAHITFWAARSLAVNGEILNYNFDRVEQSSALLQTLLLAGLHGISKMPVVALGHITTLWAALAALFYTGKLAQRILPASTLASMLLLATAPFFVYWACSGMESPLLALLLVLLLLVLDDWLIANKSLAALCFVSLLAQMARPEMPLILCIFATLLFPVRTVLKRPTWHWQSLMIFVCAQFMCAILLVTWRWWYFNDVLPQPVSAKVGSMSYASLLQGLQYIQQTWLDPRLCLSCGLAVIGALLVLRQREPLAVTVVLLLAVYCGFVVASGGDWMAAGRFWVPVLPLIMVFAALAAQKMFSVRGVRNAVLLMAMVGNVMYLWRGTAMDFNGVPLWKKTKLVAADHADNFSFFERHAREHLHDIPTIAFVAPLIEKLLGARTAQGNLAPINVMAGQMGMVPFYLTQDFGHRIHFVDRNGITERTLTDCAATTGLPRTRNGIGTGYEWIIENHVLLESQCHFVMPDMVFDIETSWNRRNIVALQLAGYMFIYRQSGHIIDEPENAWLPLRKIGAGQFIAVSHPVWLTLGEPAPVERIF